MSRKPRVQRTPEEKWQIVLEGLKSGNVAETCRLATLKCHGFWATTVCEPKIGYIGTSATPATRVSRSVPQEPRVPKSE